MQMLLPPGTSWPGEQAACLSPQLTSHPPQAPLGADLGALHLLFLPGETGVGVGALTDALDVRVGAGREPEGFALLRVVGLLVLRHLVHGGATGERVERADADNRWQGAQKQ